MGNTCLCISLFFAQSEPNQREIQKWIKWNRYINCLSFCGNTRLYSAFESMYGTKHCPYNIIVLVYNNLCDKRNNMYVCLWGTLLFVYPCFLRNQNPIKEKFKIQKWIKWNHYINLLSFFGNTSLYSAFESIYGAKHCPYNIIVLVYNQCIT